MIKTIRLLVVTMLLSLLLTTNSFAPNPVQAGSGKYPLPQQPPICLEDSEDAQFEGCFGINNINKVGIHEQDDRGSGGATILENYRTKRATENLGARWNREVLIDSQIQSTEFALPACIPYPDIYTAT